MALIGEIAGWDARLPCWRKVRHPTRAAAVEHLQRLAHQNGYDITVLETYPCRYCGGYHVGHNSQKARDMSDIRHALSNGGVAVAFLGRQYVLPSELARHPQIRVVDANLLTPRRVPDAFPPNTKLVVVTSDRIDSRLYADITNEAKRRKLPTVVRKGAGVVETLRDALPLPNGPAPAPVPAPQPPPVAAQEPAPATNETPAAAPAPTRKIAPSGAVQRFLDDVWASISPDDTAHAAAEKLLPLALKGMPTTIPSLEQAIRVRRKQLAAYSRRLDRVEHGTPAPVPQPPPPAPALQPPPAVQTAAVQNPPASPLAMVTALDTAIRTLIDMRQFIEQAEARVTELTAENKRLTAENGETQARLDMIRTSLNM